MHRWTKLNERQLTVLRRVGAGDQPVTAKDSELARTVYALRDRGLVATPRRDGVWQAEVTEAGRFYLEHGRHPDQPDAATAPAGAGSRGVARAEPLPVLPRGLAVKLLKRLSGEGGTIRIPDPDEETRAAYRRAIDAAKKNGLVPAGSRLLHTGRSRGDLIIRLEDAERPDSTDWNRVRLGARDLISDHDELVRLVQEDGSSIDVSSPTRQERALAVVRAMAAEAKRRGHKLAVSKRGRPRGLHIHVAGGHKYSVVIKEDLDKVPRVYSEAELRRRKQYRWQRVTPEFEQVPSGRLRIEIPAEEGRRHHWSETASGDPLEGKFKAFFKEVEQRAKAAEQAQQERQRQRQEWLKQREQEEEAERQRTAQRRREWEAVMTTATACARDDHRREVFAAALNTWAAAAGIREFCQQLEEATGLAPQETKTAVGRWIDWARAEADQIDPVRTPTVLVEADFDIQPTDDALRPHLGGWSPRRPEQERYYERPEARPQVSHADLDQSDWRWGRPGRAQWWRR